jgi:hypothetical protein
MTKGGARPGAGRKPRGTPVAKPIWIGQISEGTRQFILTHTRPDERFDVLYTLALKNASATDTTHD